ncbi:MAG: HEPN domain-containing protein [Armatimonadetes bacterium]|nr:HEPN domain-containing protein [Armatimonadota bacterium]
MTSDKRLIWARAFIDQAQLDANLAVFLYDIVKDGKDSGLLGLRPDLYFPAIYAHCQQGIEKALKAMLWKENGSIPRKHNPMKEVMEVNGINERRRPSHLDTICRNKKPIIEILNMAPGAASDNPSIKRLMAQKNTEYPFSTPEAEVKLPCQEISRDDVSAALKIAKPLVLQIKKYLEVAGLEASQVLASK